MTKINPDVIKPNVGTMPQHTHHIPIVTRSYHILCMGILLIALLYSLPHASFSIDDEMIYQSDELVIRQIINGTVDISNPEKLQTLTAKLHLLPIEDYRQIIVQQTITPQAQYIDNSVAAFKFSKPVYSPAEFSIDTILRTRNTYKQITRTVDYPIVADKLSEDLLQYLTYTNLIDSNEQVRAKALELAANDTDLFAIAFNVAQWISANINYDLQTITADATQKASWVYEQKRGVCDELSVLYVSMMRSLGVPARFISGISYTNSPLFSNPWSPHAWVEIYFPDYGWVPFDLTYKQFGFIDASHIALQVAADANDSATQYQWQGRNIESVTVEPGPLIFDSILLDTRAQIEDFTKPTVSLLRNKVSLTSSSAIVVTLQNTKNYYVSAQLGIAAPIELLFPQGKQIQLFLLPFEERTIFIPVTIAPGLSNRYEYQFPVAITNFYRVLSNTTLFVSQSNPTYNRAEIDTMSANALAVSTSQISAYVKPQCYANETAHVNQTIAFICEIAHDGAATLSDFSLCVNGKCIKSSLMPSSIAKYVFNLSFETVGVKQVPIKIGILNKAQEIITDVPVYDTPLMSLTTIEAPTTMKYNEQAQLRFLLQKESFVAPQKTVVRIFNKVPYIWNVGTLSANKELTVEITGSALEPGINDVPIIATFTDDLGQKFNLTDSIKIELVDVTIWQHILIWLNALIA